MTIGKIDVLVVEDDPVTSRGYMELLSLWGFATRAAHNGIAALAQIRSTRPDILLSDLDMPGMNGYELLSIVRRRYPEIRTVAMSGAFGGEQIPPGVAAEAFYPKGTGKYARLQTVLSELARPVAAADRETRAAAAAGLR
jgi:CheY-like chemotaxis protein